MKIKAHYDDIIIGGGHNGLVAANYLSKAGRNVLLLEARPNLGGASISRQIFSEYPVRLSRYSYLVSLFPRQIFRELGIEINLKNSGAEYIPYMLDGAHDMLSIGDNNFQPAGSKYYRDIAEKELNEFKAPFKKAAKIIYQTIMGPLPSREALRRRFEKQKLEYAWDMLTKIPLGITLEQKIQSNVMRGKPLFTAKIGTITSAHDETFLQNRTMLLHMIGGEGTGDWFVPEGGMGALIAKLEESAIKCRCEIIKNALVTKVISTEKGVDLEFEYGVNTYSVGAENLLANCGESILAKIMNDEPPSIDDGSSSTINILLNRFPKLKVEDTGAINFFGGSMYFNIGYDQLETSAHEVAKGDLPHQIGFEVMCHSSADRSIFGDSIRDSNMQAIKIFAVDTPYSLCSKNNDRVRDTIQRRCLASINRHCVESIEDCIAENSDGSLCIETLTPVDLEREIGLPRGHIFHENPKWPFLDTDKLRGIWGVETKYKNVFICGSSAYRGGCVSGIPGRSAAIKILNSAH